MMDDQALLRYSRHILLEGMGIEGQEALLQAHVAIIGLGGLGCAAAAYLCSAGIGCLSLVDGDTVDLSNLQRQILHPSSHLGMLKVDSAQISLRGLHPHVTIHTHPAYMHAEELLTWVQDKTVVLDCSDNFPTRHAINQACVQAGMPLVSGAAIGFEGQVGVFNIANKQGTNPCYACLFPPQADYEAATCAQSGVLSPLVGIVGSLQATEAIKIITHIGTPLAGRLLSFNALSMRFNECVLDKNPQCVVCGVLT